VTFLHFTEARLEDKVSATPAALRLIEEIVREHGPVLFHQSGGCCDGSSPMCYPKDGFIIGDTDVLLGHIGGAPVYISASQFEAWKHTDLIIDVVPGRGGMFSLDNGREVRFLTRSQVCSPVRTALPEQYDFRTVVVQSPRCRLRFAEE
jgi:uncharacterized protein